MHRFDTILKPFPRHGSSRPLSGCGVWLAGVVVLVGSLASPQEQDRRLLSHGALIREDTTRATVYLLFSGHEFADGGEIIRTTLREEHVPASFFFTGDFYRDTAHASLIRGLREDGHYLGGHSDRHLLYASWEERESTLVTKEVFQADLRRNYEAMLAQGIQASDARYFLPPYEWYNREVALWAQEEGLVLVNFTPGTLSNADYTTPDMGVRYLSSDSIMRRVLQYEKESSCGLNGFFLFMHIGTHPDRTDKLYQRLGAMVQELRRRGYSFARLQAQR